MASAYTRRFRRSWLWQGSALNAKNRFGLKAVEVKVMAELMKNSRRSDRELANIIGVSQPTVSRVIRKLEKEGYIKEYTMIPDFHKLGYELMGITSLQAAEKPQFEIDELRENTVKAEENRPHAGLMIVTGMSSNKNGLFIDFYENYAEYLKAIGALKKLRFIDVESIDSFLVNLGETQMQVLGMSKIAEHFEKKVQDKL